MTSPQARADDRAALHAMAASAVGRAADRAVIRAGASWRVSIARRLAVGASAPRAAAAVALVASSVALALTFATARPEPLTWVVPAGALVVPAIILALVPAGTGRGSGTP